MIERLWRAAGWLGIAITLVVSLMPPALDDSQGHADKIVHLAGYTVLTFWWAQIIVRERWKLAVLVVLFGVAVELLQGFTPNRHPDPLDALANSAGALLGWFAARWIPNLPGHIALLPAFRR